MIDNNLDRLTREDIVLFAGSRTTLADIRAAGWEPYGSSSGEWWFRHRDGRRFLPVWVRELEEAARVRGEESVRSVLRALVSDSPMPGR